MKNPFIVLKFKYLKYVLLLVVTAVLLGLSIDGSKASGVFFGYANRKVPIYSVSTTQKEIAISFDAAWGSDHTKEIMNICEQYNVPATFFLVGFWVDKYGDLVKEIDERGFEIGTHSNTHPDMTKLESSATKLELETSMKRITDITGKTVTLFRAPYGAYNNSVLDTATSLGLFTIQWDIDSLDWKGLSAEQIVKRVVPNAKNGSIILCHNNGDHTADALPIMLDRLKKQGFTFVKIGDLIHTENFEIDRNGVQRKLG